MNDDFEALLGDAIRGARIRKEISLEDAAARANLSPTSVRALELGRGSTVATLVKVLRVLDETGWISDFAAQGRAFSPVAALRETRGRGATPRRVSRSGKKRASGAYAEGGDSGGDKVGV